ncbi:helix-turn-helix transcriptional regulator [Micromonospora sp. NPDC051227]|uniref:helix-turn-helix transcriptional regulator n=1 Tax=Micromonospora sp. NPDC051227 TaxID=3364285 RepID=UPI0037A81DCA
MTWTANVSERVRELRKRRGWSAQRLAEEMTAVGVPWERQVVTKLENGQRQSVSLDEAVALAYVLDVAPVHLFVPPRASTVTVVASPRPDAAGETYPQVHADDVRRWFGGEQPLAETDIRVFFSEVDERTFRQRFGHGSRWQPGEAADDGER